jgi:peptidoglycan/LPS O-acetylase OafA/YrhL
LSGFLITSLLLAERSRNAGISFRHFYARRALRLLPALAILVALAAIVTVLSAPSYPWRSTPLAFVAVATYWMNWYTIGQPFAAGMLGHTWSLAIEEQFYLVWPPLLALALARGMRLRSILTGLAAGVLVAMTLRIHEWSQATPPAARSASPYARYVTAYARGADWGRWYYGSFTHMDGLLLGAAAAIVMSIAGARRWLSRDAAATRVALAAGLGTIAIVAVFAARTGVGDFVPYAGLTLFEIGAVVTIAMLSLLTSGPVVGFLALRPLVWIGRRSYGIYILHIPMYVFVLHFELGRRLLPDHGKVANGWIAFALSFVAAALSFRFVEQPVLRRKDRFAT